MGLWSGIWHSVLILGVCKSTVNKLKEAAPHLPIFLLCLSGPNVNLMHSAGPLNDMAVFMCREGVNCVGLKHLCYLGLITSCLLLCFSFGGDTSQARLETSALLPLFFD